MLEASTKQSEKIGLNGRMVLKTFEETKLVIFEYNEGFDNRKNIHSSIDYQTPYQGYGAK